ncbi:MAG: hypothetical protein PHV23_00680 [Candidatus Gracilibacteria bacterium]|nr:hypothetical protein [Candidatus Gracilibacteria bacterium]
MKKILISFIIFLGAFNTTFAHPLDISVSTANIKGNIVYINTYFHSFEIEYLLKNNGINPDGVIDYFENEDIIKKYIKENIALSNNEKKCELGDITINRDETYNILTNGLSSDYSFTCSENISKFNLFFNYFSEFKLQTNRITIYDLTNGISNLRPIIYKVLTPKIKELNLDLKNLNVVRIDSDNDGLSDEEEKVYLTNPKEIDTDGDNYTDKEEIDFGWDALNKELSPGQEYREKLDVELSNKKIDELENINKTISQKNLSDYGSNNGYLKKVMKYINDYFEKGIGNILIIFGIVYILGILHAAGPGHSKGLLIAYTLEKENGYKKGILFSIIFTITHIIDIIILFIITKVIITFVDLNDYLYYIQFLSAIVLFFLSIYLIKKAVKKEKNKYNKPSLAIAFLAGLAPCSFAWSIFLLLAALGKTNYLLPIILALGLGIFTTLVFIVILSVYLKNKAYEKIGNLGKYSSIFSSFIILIISIILLYNLI